MAFHNELGKKGESIAHDYLIDKGYSILEQNYRYKKGEIDIIAQKEGWLVVVEVKTRSGSQYGKPYEAVHELKQKLLINTIDFYIEEKELDLEIRFDIISIIDGPTPKIHHLEDAFSTWDF